MRTILTGARLFDGRTLHDGMALVIESGQIAALLPESEAPEGALERLPGGILAPGLVDLQVNGGGGVMLGDAASVEGIARICAAHRPLGSLYLTPTLITDRPEVTARVLAAGIAAAREGVPGFAGLHIEGPHLDPRRKGAHDPALIRPMTGADLAALCRAAAELPSLMVTLAPESVTPDQIAALAAAGVVVSLGHSDTALGPARAAYDAGARCTTHLFNAMSQLGNREPGLVGAALDTANAYAGLIADGIHVAPEVLRIACAAKRGEDRLFLVTDAMAPAGTDMAEFTLGDRPIYRRDGRLTLADGTLAGADVTLPAALKVMVEKVGLPLDAALRMATSTPAACIGAGERIGHLAPGRAADLVHLDDALQLTRTWSAGA
ncbi:N-acetylglucosamine-6-phosphate deacetylase [Solirhodobacter olei]|uniref:N-acetylglucosamine-6-phosphate deacetylase n=1 Tax=Solirhodobacter olei TaxID=2493082 RepID=UPI000FD9008A|nr:N-acetylglucosamine-6-phosphate deacetylase [Solirhodobacter olei]